MDPKNEIESIKHLVSNRDGWKLSLYQTWHPGRIAQGRRPVLIVPGYGMNSFIFSYHPRGLSLEGFLADAGFEVWRVDLRAQGGSVSTGGKDNYSLEDLALTDLGQALEAVTRLSHTGADRVDVIGCSLGGTFMFIHAVLNRSHRIGSMVSMGAPVRWVDASRLLRVAFAWPMLIGAIRIKGTRRLAELALPQFARHVPWLLSIYLNPGITETAAARELVKTIEDPNRHINREIAHWIGKKDLVLRGVNISEALSKIRNPLLCVVANQDGIVPPDTAVFPFKQVRSRSKKLIEVGTREISMAHADLFISNEAHARVFRPITHWLIEQNSSIQEEMTRESRL